MEDLYVNVDVLVRFAYLVTFVLLLLFIKSDYMNGTIVDKSVIACITYYIITYCIRLYQGVDGEIYRFPILIIIPFLLFFLYSYLGNFSTYNTIFYILSYIISMVSVFAILLNIANSS